jgi:hypothetical protein
LKKPDADQIIFLIKGLLNNNSPLLFLNMCRARQLRDFICIVLFLTGMSCQKKKDVIVNEDFNFVSSQLESRPPSYSYKNVSLNPVIRLSFTAPVDRTSAENFITLTSGSSVIPLIYTFQNNDSIIIVQPQTALQNLTKYVLNISNALKSARGTSLNANIPIEILTVFNNSDKFPRITDSALLDLVESQTLKYFWDFGHPVSGLARERNSSGDIVTSGGSGFGIMAMVAGINRNFITRTQGLSRMQTIVSFLKNNAQTFHGAFPHWLNGATGQVVPFSTKDNGADLVETSYLVMGLLTARQYFNGASPEELALRNNIDTIWKRVEWNWFRQGNQNVLYWHWSPNYNWDINMQVKGWNECLITYVLAASSPGYSIPKTVYDNGWASNGGMKNNNNYYGYLLPLGQPFGGPLFYAHYSFMGINPTGLTDLYANYQTQNTNHTLINYTYCVTNPKGFAGYSDSCWGLTASDDYSGYKVHSPTSDNGVISPTAAISSFPYTPAQSMKALKFFYYKLGDKTWGPYGFYDAFSLQEPWFANSTLAIDQGPIVVMIENYRSGLLWNLFFSCPEVKTGMTNLGFQSPFL